MSSGRASVGPAGQWEPETGKGVLLFNSWKSRAAAIAVASTMVAVPAIGLASGPAGAAPQKACPSDDGGWFLTPPSPGDTVVDRNGDGLICVKAVSGRGSSRDVPGFSVRDDLIFLI